MEMTNGHHLNKSESPSSKDDLGHDWMKLASGSGEDFFYFSVHFTFSLLSPLGNDQWSSHEQI
jgi:hypothetical protein